MLLQGMPVNRMLAVVYCTKWSLVTDPLAGTHGFQRWMATILFCILLKEQLIIPGFLDTGSELNLRRALPTKKIRALIPSEVHTVTKYKALLPLCTFKLKHCFIKVNCVIVNLDFTIGSKTLQVANCCLLFIIGLPKQSELMLYRD